MDQTYLDNLTSTQQRVSKGGVSALVMSSILGTLGSILLLSALSAGSIASASSGGGIQSNLTRQIAASVSIAAITSVHVTKTVEPPDPDTGEIVSICFTISGLEPRKVDVVLAQDVSESMRNPAGEGITQTRLEACQAAASAFVGSLPSADRTAVVPYSSTARLAQPLTTTKSIVTNTIYGLTAAGSTNIGEGISVSHKELITSPRYLSDTAKAIILLSDGKANLPVDEETAKQYARARAQAAASDNIKIYTIGFGNDADKELLEEIADISSGQYFFAPDSDVLETIYLTIALELHHFVITDVLAPGVETDCSQWPNGWCVKVPGGVTTITIPIDNSLLVSDPVVICFTATVNLDPNYKGPINLPGSGICYQDSEGQTICEEFDNPVVTVGGRKIAGHVFYDVNADGQRDTGEIGAPDVTIRTSTGVTTTTDVSGSYVLRTSSEPTISVAIEVPLGYAATTPTSEDISPVSGTYTVDFGIAYHSISTTIYLPVVARNHPLPAIINGDFEDGWTGWTHGGELPQTITSTNPYSGGFSALLGYPSYKCENGVPVGSAWIEQAFLVPYTNNPRLVFWYNIFTQDKNPYLTDEFDSFDVRINGARLFREARRAGAYGCDASIQPNLGWKIGEVDLGNYRGQRVAIRFENRSWPDGWFNTWTFVDHVRFVP